MPYTKPGRRREVIAERKRATEEGDWNLLYTIEYLDAFIANPSYATIHKIGKAAKHPQRLEGVGALEDFLTVNGVSAEDREEARDEALAEFRRRIVGLYEDHCIELNGDLEEYKQAQIAIIRKFGALV